MHPIHRVQSFRIEAPYTLRVRFEDDTEQLIDFRPVLAGELFGPLFTTGRSTSTLSPIAPNNGR
jgi:hypothetical protein